MHSSRIAFLFRAYFQKRATAAEREELMNLITGAEHDEALKKILDEAWEQYDEKEYAFSETESDRLLSGILPSRKQDDTVISTPPRIRRLRPRLTAALAIILVLAGAALWVMRNQRQLHTNTAPSLAKTVELIKPGSNQAILTLANGSHIALDSAHPGPLATQGHVQLHNLNSATLTYQPTLPDSEETLFNTLSTPNGGQYQLVLSDGTRVWLNAASSIRFPVAFAGNERSVSITGEAYFEVTKNPAKPFIVTTKDATVQVLGTHFNVMAYDDEVAQHTTLLEGAVKISNGHHSKLLAPGQESRISKAGDISISEADVEEVMAWKNGWFQFNGYDVEKVMRQVARWYAVDVVYKDVPAGHFTGMISRANNISQVLQILKAGGVGFAIDGRTITVFSQHP